jgi:ubiquinone/menaquinone biosynthesis C-methylase UbiE
MSNDAARFVGDIPWHYDQAMGPMIFVDYADDIARRTVACGPARVLEIAAGTGIVTRRLRALLPADAHLIATDLNPPMLEIARAKFQLGEQVEFQQADAMALPFPDGSFDTVVCQFGVMFFPDKDKAYREVYRVLKPGGHYLFNIWDSHRFNPFGRLTHEVVDRFFPVDPPQFMKVPFSYQFEPIKESTIESGFTELKAAVLMLEKQIPDSAAFARGLIHGSPIIDQLRERGGVEPETIAAALAQAFVQEFGKDPGRMPLQAIVFSAKKAM